MCLSFVHIFVGDLSGLLREFNVVGDPSLPSSHTPTQPLVGCKNSMLGSKEHVLQRTSGILSDCDLECMTPECGYDFGACDDEIGGLNKLDFDVYLDSIVTFLTILYLYY